MESTRAGKALAAVLVVLAAGSAFAKATGFVNDMDAAERELAADEDASARLVTPGESGRVPSDRWSPVGLPFVDVPAREGGCNVYGIDVGMFYPRKSTVAGVQLGLLSAVSSQCYGIKCGLWGSSVQEPSAGIMAAGCLSIADDSFRGVMLTPVGNAAGRFGGVQVGAANVASPDSFAVQAGIMNSASDASGLLLQVGLYNYVSGGDAAFVQVGLLNASERVRRTTTPLGKATTLPLLRIHWN